MARGPLARLYRNENDYDFPKSWKIFGAISAVLVVVSIVSLLTRGFELSIDFEGGSVWEVPSAKLTVAQAREVLKGADKDSGAKVQTVTDANGKRIVRIQAAESSPAESQKIAAALAEKAGVKDDDVGTNTVGPSWGSTITGQAIRALVVFLIVIAAYISWQLEWRMAVSAIIAVIHDVLLTVGFYSLFGFEVTPATVISVLTILGFSLYDTVVVYDRVRENAARYDRAGHYTYTAMMRRSLNQVLMRSFNTTLVALIPEVAILVVGGIVAGQSVLMDFSLALVVGIFAGAYSSLEVAASVVVWLKERESKYARIRERARERGTEAEADHIPVLGAASGPKASGAAASGTPVASGAIVSPASHSVSDKALQYQRPTPPRPRKQGKRR
ncbi:MAG TPA: protein translocase subunit SecF [Microthrixaceae bacterium]|nr:protein translocase subunit SecF [Microthrixaceae bacterium]